MAAALKKFPRYTVDEPSVGKQSRETDTRECNSSIA
jgi:hypothetical protein